MPLVRFALVAFLFSGCAVGTMSGGEPRAEDPAGESPAATTLAITSPAEGSLLTTTRVEVQGNTNALEVTVGGTTVEVVDGRFSALAELVEGENTIVVRAAERTASVRVLVDSEPPLVEILSPAPGSYVMGDVLEVRGRVTDANVGTVTIGDEAISLEEDGTFTWSRETGAGAQRVRVTATDRAGHVGSAFTTALVGTFAPAGEAIPAAAALHVGPRALDAVADGIEPYLAPAYLRPMLLARNPVLSGGWGRLEALGESHATSTVTITPGTGTLTIRVRLTDIAIPLKAFINYFPDLTGTAYVDVATATIVANVGASGGRPVVTIGSTSVVLEGLLVDVDGLWSWIDRHVVTAAVRGKVESSISALAARQIPPAVEGAIERIPLSRDFTVMDEPARLSASVESFRVSTGGLSGSFGVAIEALEPDPALAWAPGSILVDVGAAPSDAHQDVRAALSLDVVNAALHAGWSTGRYELFLRRASIGGDPVTVGFLGLLAPGVRDLAPPDAPVSLHVRPALPPVVTPSEDGTLIVTANDLRVAVIAETDSGDVPLFEVSVAVAAPLSVSARDNAVSLALGEIEITADAVSGAELPPAADLDTVLRGLVGPLPERYTTLEGLELPNLLGFALTDYAAELEAGYLVFEARLTRL